MKQYTITAHSGLALPAETPIRLAERQLRSRAHLVRPVKGRKGVYVSDVTLSFKVGETIEIDGDLPKSLAALTSEPMEPSAPTRAEIQGGGPAVAAVDAPSA